MAKKHDGWIIQSLHVGEPWFYIWTFARTRTETAKLFEKSYGEGSWPKYRRGGFHKLVKIKLVEVA